MHAGSTSARTNFRSDIKNNQHRNDSGSLSDITDETIRFACGLHTHCLAVTKVNLMEIKCYVKYRIFNSPVIISLENLVHLAFLPVPVPLYITQSR